MIKTPVKVEETIDHTIHPHRKRWIICEHNVEGEFLVILDDKNKADQIALAINQQEKIEKELANIKTESTRFQCENCGAWVSVSVEEILEDSQ